MHALVLGGTGLVGTALVELLVGCAEVRRVTSLVRRASEPAGEGHPKLVERVVRFEDLESELEGLARDLGGPTNLPTHCFCCLGTTIAKAGSQAAFERVDHDYPLALGRFAVGANVEVFTIVTALGADAGSRIFYNRVKGRVEEDLKALGLRRLRIVQPSLLLGERSERRFGERTAAAVMGPLQRVFLGPLRKYRPIPAESVARAMLEIALHPGDDLVRTYPSDVLTMLAALTGGTR